MNKKLLLLTVLALLGCEDETDQYALRKTLTPTEVVALHKVCKSQPNYDTSWVLTRSGNAKGVMCRYLDVEYISSHRYTIDAADLRDKLEQAVAK